MIAILVLQAGAAAAGGDAPVLPGASGARGAPLFAEAGERAFPGVSVTCGEPSKQYIVEVNGGGLLAGDFDADGDHDLVVVDGSTLARVAAGQPGFPPRLLWNDGKAKFSAADEPWSMAGGRWGMGGACGDVDGDGRLDLVVTEWGPNRVFSHRAAGSEPGARRLVETTATAGLVGEEWSSSAAFLDYDRDGVLDLVVVRYLHFDPAEIPPNGGGPWRGHMVMKGPEGLVPVHDQLYRGAGDGTFVETTLAAGFRPPEAGYGLGVMTLDHDGDGDTDLYVANDSTPSHLWENNGDGTLREVGFRLGVALDASGKERASMGIGCGDVDGDGAQELLVTNFSGEENGYYTRKGRTYRDSASAVGLGGPSKRWLGWGTALADLDLDRDLDAFVLNGHVYPQADLPDTDTSYAQADQLFRNASAERSKPRFEVEALSDGGPRVSRASTAADFDGDGDLDLVALPLDGQVRFLENRAERSSAPRHWLAVRLAGRSANRQGLGARITARSGAWSQLVEIRTAGVFQTAVPAEAQFGLGDLAQVERLEVRWPSGRVQELASVKADQVLVVEELAEAPK